MIKEEKLSDLGDFWVVTLKGIQNRHKSAGGIFVKIHVTTICTQGIKHTIEQCKFVTGNKHRKRYKLLHKLHETAYFPV